MLLNASYTTILNTAIADVTSVLTTFAADSLFAEKFALAFGITVSSEQFLQTVAVLPQIEVRSDAELEGALGAFSAQTQKIYLSESLLKGDLVKLRSVLIEEIGHFVDAQVNTVDSPGDEGAIFAAVVLGQDLSSSQLAQLKAEDDHAVVVINGQETAIEMANATAIQLNGANQQVDIGTWFNYQNFTVEMWVKAGATQVTYADIIDNNHTDSRSWVVQQDQNAINHYYFGVTVNGSPVALVYFDLTPSTWQHLAFVKDVNSISVYIDGVIVGSTPYSGSINYDGSQFLRLGNWGSGGRNWNGSIDEVRIWNTVRTASEIANNYNGSISPNSTGLVAYYAFDEGTGSTSADLTLNGNIANLINNPTWVNEGAILLNNPKTAGTIAFSNSQFSVNEDGIPITQITLTRTGGSTGEVSTTINLTNGTAWAGETPNDYNNAPITVNFADGETSKTVTIPITDDNLIERNETVNLTLTDPTNGATLGTQNTATLTIIDNETSVGSLISANLPNSNYTASNTWNSHPESSFDDPFSTGWNSGGFPVQWIEVDLGKEYALNTIQLLTGQQPDGNTTHEIWVSNQPIAWSGNGVLADTTQGYTKNAQWLRDDFSNITIGRYVQIKTVASPSWVGWQKIEVYGEPVQTTSSVISFSNSQFSVNEDGTAVNQVTLTRTEGSTGEVIVTLNLTDGTATAGSDYNNSPINVTFADGEISKTVTIPTVNDTRFEADETVNLTLTNPQGGAILGTQTTATLTIINDDLPQPGAISLNSSSYTVNENGTPSINLIRTGGSDGEVSATLNLTDGTATAGNDYIQTPITVTFADGETSKTVNLTQASQGLSFDGSGNYISLPASSLGGAITIEAWVYADDSNRGWQRIIDFGNGSPSDNIVLGWLDTSGKMFFDIDNLDNSNGNFSRLLTNEVFPEQQWIHVEAVNDGNGNAYIYWNGELKASGTNQLVPSNTIRNNQYIGRSNWSADPYFVGKMDDVRIWNKARTQAEIQADFNRELTGNETGLVGYWNFNSVNGNTVQDLTSNNNDGTLVGAQSTTGFSTSLIIDDNIYEPTATVNLTLSNPTGGATLGTQQNAVLNIIDNDANSGTIQFSNTAYSINENGTPVTTVTLTRSGGSDGEVAVTLTPSNGTATAGSDYNNIPITVNFANGETSKIVIIPIINDTLFEPNETINLTLSNPTNGATLGTQTTASLTIIDNDINNATLLNPVNFTLNNSAKFTIGADGVSSVLRLTDDYYQLGRAFLTNTITLSNNASFSTYFKFQISARGWGDEDGLGADGLSFAIQTASGDFDDVRGVAIEFDTFNNTPNNISDINGNHVGVNINGDINSVVSQPVTNRLNNGNIWSAWVDYNGLSDVLELRLSETNQRPNTAFLNYTVDLPSVLGQTDAFIGFTSRTGAGTGDHDILDWQFNNSYSPITEIANSELDFSGVQGQNNWYYGYYDGPFNSSDFQQMTQFNTDAWRVQAGSYWTGIGSATAHGNGTNGNTTIPIEQWAVRRWISEANGTIQILGHLAKVPTAMGGDGIKAYIFVDGVEVWSQSIGAYDATGINYQIETVVNLNSVVDFALAPQSNDYYDTTIFTAQVKSIESNSPGILSFSSPQFSVNEDGTPITQVTLIRTGGSNGEITVTLTPSNGNATAGSDYNNSPINVTFADGETNKTITIPVVNDSVYEPTETVNLTLSNPTGGATLGTQQNAVLNIIDNDANSGTIQFSNTAYSINENGTLVTAVTLTRSNGSDGEVSVRINLTNGTATAGSDYNNSSITVNFTNGETSKTVNIPIVNDTQLEADETINLSLSNPQGGATLGTQTTAVLTIVNDDLSQPGTISFNTANYTVNENATASINLVRTGGSDGEVSITLTPTDGTATAGSDYNNSPITVTFANGETSKTVTIPIIDDTIYEPNETISLTLSNPTGGATLGTQQTAILSIVDNDAKPGTLQFSDTAYSVNENGTPVTEVTLTRTGGSDGAITARINLSNITATAGSDYYNNSITVNFANGETSKTVTIPLIDDNNFENTETLQLTLANPSNGATIGTQNSAIVSIIDNDFKPTLTVNINADQITEGNSIQGTVTRNTDTTTALTVTLVNSDNSQLTIPTTVTIPIGSTSANFTITAVDDTLIELPKNYTVIATAQGFVSSSDSLVVLDNDAVTLSLSINATNINENGGKILATVTRNIVTDTPLQVQLSSNDTTEATVPNTVIIGANQASATFEITSVDDILLDGTQSVIITAKPTYTSSNVTLDTGNATATINVLDNESPSLQITIDKDVISETGTATATITRNTNTNSELIVTLTSSDTSEATVPNTVTIPIGQTSATVTITGVSDGINDGSQSVTITASSNGLNSGTDNLEITDINVPDLVVTQLQGLGTTYTSKQAQFTYTVVNNGIISATGSWSDRVYLSTDNILDANDTLLGEFGLGSTENPANLLPGTSYDRTVTYFAPRTPGNYYLIATTDSGNTVNEGLNIGENNNTTITPVSITPAYRGVVYTDTETSVAGTPITLRGQALSNSDNSPVAFEFVKVRVENKGTIREYDAFTDANGNFVRQFTPLSGEAGTYNINAYFPGFTAEDTVAEDSFTLLGMRFEQNDQFLTQVSQRITEGTTLNGSVKLQNLSNIELSGLTATINGAPSDWIVSLTPEKTNLLGNEEITVNYSINVPDDKWSFYNFSVGLNTTQGVTANLPVRVDVTQLLPRLVADTSNLQASMLRGGQTLVEFTVSNQGDIPSGPLDIFLPDASWLKLASPVTLPSLNQGESTKVSLLLQPSATQDLTVYNGNVVIAGAETSLNLPFNFRAVSEAKGNLNINVVDELFFFAEGSPRLQNATVTLLDPFTGTVIFSEQDADGILAKTNLAEGYYTLRINANSHDSYEKNIYVGAGETEDVQAFLSRQTVKYTWTVTPTEIQDQYTISIESVFETNVPVPTVVIEPNLLDFADLQVVGQVMQIDMKVTNHGLIAANDIALNIGDHPFYKIEPLINGVDILGAKSSITIPVRITRIADFDTLSSSGSELALQSTPSVPCRIFVYLDYYYECADEQIKRTIPLTSLNVEGNCSRVIPWSWGPGPDGRGVPDGNGGVTPVTVNIQANNCDPCKEKNLQGAICVLQQIPGCFPATALASTLFNCLIGIADGTASYGDVANCVPKPCVIDILLCLCNFCFSNGNKVCDFLNKPFGTLDISSLAIEASNASPSINNTIDSVLSDFIGYGNALQSYLDATTVYFGDSIWLSLQGEDNQKLQQWLEVFSSKLQGTTADEVKISESEKIELLNIQLPAPLSSNNVERFIERWNRSIDYWTVGIKNLADVPEGESTNFIAIDKFKEAIQLWLDTNTQAQADGYDSLINALETKTLELQEALEGDSSGVCATVTIKIDQEAVMTRAAFLGNLEISNGNSTNLENLSVTLQIKDANGNIVNDLFGITSPILNNITSVDGTGILIGDDPNTPQNEGIGSAQWTFIPTNLAAPEIPAQYTIGGSLSYLENGATVTVPLLSTPITVYPQAELYLDYFHQRDVFADDPFTDDITETSVPYELAVLIKNQGKGAAKNLKITSGQPKIIENEKGLLIDFQIIGSEVNGQGVSPSLTVDFGNIAAGDTAVAEWLLKSSLQGKFIDYKATFEHINSLGKAELSLIKEVKIHELIHSVKVTHANPDNLNDFLVNETFDAEFTPDIIYFSSGGTAPVKAVKNATIDSPATLNDLTVQISATVEAGWTYFRLAEPSNSQFDIVKILRSDGTEIGLDNLWTTDRTFPGTGRPTYENILHFVDNTTAGNTTYTVVYTPGGPTVTDIIDVSPDPIANAVNAISVDFSEAVQLSSFNYNDLSLTLNGGSNLINSSVSIVVLSATRYQITGLSGLTNTDGEYNLTVNATGIQDSGGKWGQGSLNETWTKTVTGTSDTTAPVLNDIVNLLSNPRNQTVASLTVTFSEKIDLSTFTWQDITLTRDSGTKLINSAVTITAINDTSYRINGLTSLTATDGSYTLTVNGSGIQDLSGNAGTGTQTESWVMDTTAPTTPINVSVTNALNPLGASLAPLQTLQPLTVSGQQRINTTNPTISGELGETGLKVFFYDKTTNTLLQQATVTGTQFAGTVTLPSPGARELDIQVQDAAGNITKTALSLFADISQPVLTQFLNVPTSTPNPVSSIDVQFSEQIDLNTFDKSDLTLTRDGVTLTLPDTIIVTYLADTTYRINGLEGLTNTPGTYSFQVDATSIQDNSGNSGDAPKTTNFTITAPPSPGITLTQTGGNTSLTEGGNTDTYSLVLKTQPTSDVIITLATNNQITLNQTTFTFTTANWNILQTVTVTAVDDTVTEGNHTAIINHTVSSSDANYNSLTIPAVNVGIQDNDAELKGTIWNDIDGNAINNSEPKLSGWTVYLDSNNNNQLDTGESSTQSDANGNYNFTNLRPGTYTVAQIVQTGWQQTYPILNITTTASDIALSIPTLDFLTASEPTLINFNSANYIVQEDGTAVTEFWVTRTGNVSNAVIVTLSFLDGTAKGCSCAASSVNNDFSNVPFTLTFAENETNKLITVQNAILGNPNAIRIRNDNKVEGNETFTIKLTNPTGGAVIGDQGTATVTILDDESPTPVTPPLESPGTTLADAGDDKALSLISLDKLWQDSRFLDIKGKNYSTVIIDTGIDLNHPFFGPDANNDGIADKIIYQYDFADNDTNASDKNNHGSHVASIVSSVAPDANLIVLKVFKDGGSGSFADLEKALQWVNTNASTYNIASVNLSLGDSQNWITQTSRYGIGDELASIANQNVIISAAAGNSFYQFNSTQGLAYPAIDPNVVAVGAVWSGNFGGSKSFNGGAIDYTTSADQIASFSQRDDLFSEVFAPGILIKGANATGGTISMGGTSQAAPFLTGLATLAQEIAQDVLGRWLSVNEFRYLLDTTSNLIVDGDNENDNVINTGLTFPRINALKLAEGILSFSGINPDPNTGNSGSNSGGNPPTSPNAVSLVHTVNLVAGQVATGIDFGNQMLNQPPTITSATTANFAENGTGIAYTVTASDPDAGTTLTYGLLNSDVDTSLFNINSTTGAITFKTAPDFETPLDKVANNTYNLTVTASDGSLTSSKAIILTVTDLNEIQGNPLVNNGRNPIVGTAGPDYLTGGAGAKTLTGGGGNDSFVFTNMRDVGQRIADFTVGEDKLVFTQLFSSLSYKGSNPIADSYIKFVQGTGANSAHTFLQIDRDGLTGTAIARNFLQVDNITPNQLNDPNNFQF